MLTSTIFHIEKTDQTFRAVEVEPIWDLSPDLVDNYVYDLWEGEDAMGCIVVSNGLKEWKYEGCLPHIEVQQIISRLIICPELNRCDDASTLQMFSFVTPTNGTNELITVMSDDAQEFAVRVGDKLKAVLKLSIDGKTWLVLAGALSAELIKEVGKQITALVQ